MRERIQGFLKSTFFVDDIPDEASFLRSGIIDSSGVLELVQFLEEEFALVVADEDLVPENLDSVASVMGFIERKRHQSSTPAFAA